MQARVKFFGELCDAKIQDLDRSAGRDLDVRRFQVAMDDPFGMRRLQCRSDIGGVAQRLAQKQRASE